MERRMQKAHLRRTPEQMSRAALGGVGSNLLGLLPYSIKVSEPLLSMIPLWSHRAWIDHFLWGAVC
jgi:hypothetical protein